MENISLLHADAGRLVSAALPERTDGFTGKGSRAAYGKTESGHCKRKAGGKTQAEKSLLDVLELNEEVNDIFSNQRLTKILSSIAYGGDEDVVMS